MAIFSVLMCCYNAEEWLEKSIKTVLEQSFRDFEFLLINDGSTDGTLRIIRNFSQADSRIRMFDKPNSGLSDSLNFGLRRASAKWIARLDADDFAMPDRLQVQADALSADNRVKLLGAGCEEILEGGKIIRHLYPKDHSRLVRRLETMRAFFPHSSAVFDRGLALKLGGYREIASNAQDWDLWLRISAEGRIASVEKPLVQILRHPGQMSFSDGGKLQFLSAFCCSISHFIGKLGGVSPMIEDDPDRTSRFFSWVGAQLKKQQIIELSEKWLQTRNRFFSAKPLAAGLFPLVRTIARHNLFGHVVKSRYTGFKLPEKLARRWLSEKASNVISG